MLVNGFKKAFRWFMGMLWPNDRAFKNFWFLVKIVMKKIPKIGGDVAAVAN